MYTPSTNIINCHLSRHGLKILLLIRASRYKLKCHQYQAKGLSVDIAICDYSYS